MGLNFKDSRARLEQANTIAPRDLERLLKVQEAPKG
jgi:hypothetical protein